MKVYMLPGGSGRSQKYWYRWLARELRPQGIEVVVISQNRLDPSVRARQLMARYKLTDESVIVGHSFGGLAALKWLEYAGTSVVGLVLVDASVKEVFQVKQKGKIEKIRRRYFECWNWKLDLHRAAQWPKHAAVLSERRTEQSYSAWKPAQVRFARALKCQLVSSYGKKQHFTAKQEPVVLQTIQRLLKT